jgi:hypothetical protein
MFRQVKGGPRIPARICMDDAGRWYAEICGERCGDASENPLYADKVMWIWQTAREQITEAEYRAACAKRRAPDAPDARKPIDLLDIPPLF